MLLVAVSVLGLVGCGATTDEDEVAHAIKRVFAVKDVSDYCEQLTTTRFIRRVYENGAHCRDVVGESDLSEDDVRVSRVEIDGLAATARVRLADDFAGTIEVRKEGGRWRVDDYGEDLQRLMVKTLLLSFTKDERFDKQLVGKCATRLSTELPEDRVRPLAYAMFGERLTAKDAKPLGGLLGMCIVVVGQPGAEAVMGRFFEEAMSSEYVSLSDATKACMAKTMDPSATSDLYSPDGELRVTQKARRAFAAAANACREKDPARKKP